MIDYTKIILDSHFKYEKIFDLNDYYNKLSELYNELALLRKESYEQNYRFIFLHYDTDYYITNDQPGILLRNLQRMLWSLKIGNFFCLILSQQDLKKELEQLRLEETTDSVPIACITHALQDIIHFPKFDLDINLNQIDKHYINLARVKRFHRMALFTLLKDKNLIDKGLVSFGSQLH